MPHIGEICDPYPPRKDINLLFVIAMPDDRDKADLVNRKLSSLISQFKTFACDSCDYNTRINVMRISDSVSWTNNSLPVNLTDFHWIDLSPSSSYDYRLAVHDLNENLCRRKFQASVSGSFIPVIVYVADLPILDIEDELKEIWKNRWYQYATKIGFYTNSVCKKSLEGVIGNPEFIFDIEQINMVLPVFIDTTQGRIANTHKIPATLNDNKNACNDVAICDWDDSDW